LTQKGQNGVHENCLRSAGITPSSVTLRTTEQPRKHGHLLRLVMRQLLKPTSKSTAVLQVMALYTHVTEKITRTVFVDISATATNF